MKENRKNTPMDDLTRHLAQELASIDTSVMNIVRNGTKRETQIRLDVPVTAKHIENFTRQTTFMTLRLAASPLREFSALPPWLARFFFIPPLRRFTESLLDEDEDVAAEMETSRERCMDAGCDLEEYDLLYGMTSGAVYGATNLLMSILAGRGDGGDLRPAFLPQTSKNGVKRSVFSMWTSELWMAFLSSNVRSRIEQSAARTHASIAQGFGDVKLPLRDWLLRETARFMPRKSIFEHTFELCASDALLYELSRIAALESSEGADIAKAMGEEALPELADFVRTRFTDDGELELDDLRAVLRYRNDREAVRNSPFGEFLAEEYGFDFIEDNTSYEPSMTIYVMPGVGHMTISDLIVHAAERIVRFLDEPTHASGAAMLRGAAWFLCEGKCEDWNPVHTIAERLLAARIKADVLETAAGLAPRGINGRAFLSGPAERFIEDRELTARFAASGFEEV